MRPLKLLRYYTASVESGPLQTDRLNVRFQARHQCPLLARRSFNAPALLGRGGDYRARASEKTLGDN